MSFLDNLNWRYATKKFDSTKKVSVEDKDKLLEAIRMTPTSFGLQPFHINIIIDPAVREELKKSAWNQSQITDADFLLVFSARIDLFKRVDDFLNVMSGGDIKAKEELKSYGEMMTGSVSGKSEDDAKNWAAKQAYIALGFAMAACAELQIDSCPMEGFDADAFKKVLNLPAIFYPQAVLAVGYRSIDDKIGPKVRFPKEELFS